MRSTFARRIRYAGAAFAIALACAAFHAAQGQTTLAVVRVVGPPNDGYKAVYYGVKSGIFKKYGLDVQTSLVASGAAAAAALSGGAADIAYTNILTLIQAHTHNVPMVFVAPGNLQLPGKSQTNMLVLADSPIKSGKDLVGKTLGSTSLRDINAAASLAWIDKTGGDSKTLKVVEVPASAGAAFLEEHRADAVTLNEPAVSQALATGKIRILAPPYDAVGAGMTAGFAAMAPYVAQNRDVMARFAKAMHEASVYTNTHLADTVDLVAAYTNVPPDVVAKSVRFVDAEYLEPRYLQPMIDLCARYNLIDKDFPAAEVIGSVAVKRPR
ncbi:MAG TPA: ABC transporter substrate-binding protein [Candidatus Lustribacter sp.]